MYWISTKTVRQFTWDSWCLKGVTFVTSVHLDLTILVVSLFLSAKVSPEWRLNPGFGTQKKCPFPLNRSIPSKEVRNTKNMWTFFWEQSFVPCMEVSLEKRCSKGDRGSTVLCYWLIQYNCSYYRLSYTFIFFHVNIVLFLQGMGKH